MNIFKKNDIIFSAGIGLISRICTIIIRFISLPLILSIISKERYGLWLIIISIIGWLGMSDLGIPSATQNHLINLRSLDKIEQSRNTVSYAIKFLSTIGFITLCIISLCVFYAPIANWLSVSENLEIDFKAALVICVFGFGVGLPAKLGGVLFNVHGQLSFQPLFEIFNCISILLLLLIALKLNWDSLVSLAIIYVISSIAGGVTMTLIAMRKYKYKFMSKKIHISDRKIITSKGGVFFVTTIGELLILQSDAFLIGSIIGANKVALYLMPATIFINFLQIQNIWLRPLWPLLTNLYMKNDLDDIYNRLKQTLIGSVFVALIFGLGLILWGNTFIRYWSHETVGMSSIMAWGFAIYILTASIDNILATFLNSLNKIELRFMYTLVFGICKVIIGWQLLSKGDKYIEWLPIAYSVVMITVSIPIATLILIKTLNSAKSEILSSE